MLRTRHPVRLLGREDTDAALALCARDPAAHVFVASRIRDGALAGGSSVHGHFTDGRLTSLLWTTANVVPVATDARARAALVPAARQARRRCASFLGPSAEVMPLWELAGDALPSPPRSVRATQPLLATRTAPHALGVTPDGRVRPARADEVDLVVPAAAHMFTAEIGYPPFVGSPVHYRESVRRLVAAGRTYVVVEGGEVVFKADVGSVALGACQVQGVWLAPRLRGQGLAAGLLSAAVEQILSDHAPLVTLYVNDYNAPALAAYRRIGMEQVGTYATVLL